MYWLANLTAICPTAPRPTIQTLSFLLNLCLSLSFSEWIILNAVIPAENNGAAFSNGILFGSGNTLSTGTWICELNPPNPYK